MSNLAMVSSRGGIGRRNGLKILGAIYKKRQNIRFLRLWLVEIPEIMSLINHSFRHILVTRQYLSCKTPPTKDS